MYFKKQLFLLIFIFSVNIFYIYADTNDDNQFHDGWNSVTYDDGTTYEGYFLNGVYNGFGTFTKWI